MCMFPCLGVLFIVQLMVWYNISGVQLGLKMCRFIMFVKSLHGWTLMLYMYRWNQSPHNIIIISLIMCAQIILYTEMIKYKYQNIIP